jgi:hypothetical protein
MRASERQTFIWSAKDGSKFLFPIQGQVKLDKQYERMSVHTAL